MEPYLDKGYHLFTDNWYNALPLTKYMSFWRTYITGTLRSGIYPSRRDEKEIEERRNDL